MLRRVEEAVAKTVVVKIGTSSLTESTGELNKEHLRRLAAAVAEVHEAGHHVLLVTSAAISAGYPLLGYKRRPTTTAGKQAAAAVGQGLLMEEYTAALAERGIVAAQLLLTRDDFRDKRRYNNAHAALEVLLSRRALPIINENDSVSVAELKLGDNDMLSAQLAAMIHADVLVLATDTDGLYTADPRYNKDAEHIGRIEKIGAEHELLAGGAGTSNGTGGMQTKINGAKLASSAGVSVVICSSKEPSVFLRAIEGRVKGTYVTAQKSMKTRLQWMAFYAPSEGRIYIDTGAAEALARGGSLLPAGVRAVEGDFGSGALVEVRHRGEGTCLGRGLTNYESALLTKIMGLSSEAVRSGYGLKKAEIIHRDNYVSLAKNRLFANEEFAACEPRVESSACTRLAEDEI